MIVIDVENLSKRYLIGHQQPERYATLRDAIAGSAKVVGSRLLHPFRRSSAQTCDTSTVEEFSALQDVSFQVMQGERVGIIGRNGAGKSTLLKILSRITEPSTGRVRMRGRVASLLEVGTGFHPELTGRENIFLNGAILGMARSELRKKFDEIVAFAEVEQFLDTPVKRYSSGMYVRLAFAVAAYLEPDILIIDEVLSVGDVQFQKKCMGKMEEVGREGRTVLFVSHNMNAVRKLCGRAILLERGMVELNGNADEVINKYLQKNERKILNTEICVSTNNNKNADIRICKVCLINNDDIESDYIYCDDEFTLCIEYVVNNDIGYRVGIVFTTPDQVVVSTVISNFENTISLHGKKNIKYKIRALIKNIFSEGTYYVGIYVKNSSGSMLDYVDEIPFTVVAPLNLNRSNRERGIVSLPTKWNFPVEIKGHENAKLLK